MWAGIDDGETERAIRAAFDTGINTFDTAEAYGNGHSERILAKSLSRNRDQVIYATKVFANHLKRDQVFQACERSLKNLKTDRIDLYQIHWPSGSFGSKKVPIEETMDAMNELKAQGKIRAIGVSNFSRAQLDEAAGHGEIVSLQPPYSLLWRHVETDAMPYCIDNNMAILAYSPMAQGILTGKFGPNHDFEKGDHRTKNRLFQPEIYLKVLEALDQLRSIAEEYSCTLGQLALAWIIAQPQACAIAGARSQDQAIENAAAANITIANDVLLKMDKISRMVTDHLDENPMMWKF
jgi:aryl-alcohol dehydrogenase-like predicted oxidoreductase